MGSVWDGTDQRLDRKVRRHWAHRTSLSCPTEDCEERGSAVGFRTVAPDVRTGCCPDLTAPEPVADLLLSWIAGRTNMNTATNVTGSGCFPALVPVADDAGTGEIDDCGFSAVRLAGGSASMHSRA